MCVGQQRLSFIHQREVIITWGFLLFWNLVLGLIQPLRSLKEKSPTAQKYGLEK